MLNQPAQNTQARYNVCTTTTVDTIVANEDERRPVRCVGVSSLVVVKAAQGFEPGECSRRDVTEKPFFSSAFKRNRCLIPLSGYDEWQHTPGTNSAECSRSGVLRAITQGLASLGGAFRFRANARNLVTADPERELHSRTASTAMCCSSGAAARARAAGGICDARAIGRERGWQDVSNGVAGHSPRSGPEV